MKPLPNYLLTQRKRRSLSQEEVGFLLGITGMHKGNKVCRDEKFARAPSLPDALAYEAIFDRPVRELFAGLYQQVEQDVATRAKLLNFRKVQKPDLRRQQALIHLAQKASVNPSNR